MNPRICFIMLDVDDLQRALQFYRKGLGLPPPGLKKDNI